MDEAEHSVNRWNTAKRPPIYECNVNKRRRETTDQKNDADKI